MSLPYIKCPKCGERNSPPQSENYFQCSSCGYLEPKGSIILEENKDYEEEREKLIEVREEELRKWEEEQEDLCREVIKDLLPNQKVEVSFLDRLPFDNWGMSLYRENDINKAIQARKRLAESGNLGQPRINKLITYSQMPSQIIISRQSLTVKEINSKYGLAGFLPTPSHEAAHISPEVNHDPLYQPWINNSHDDVWRRVSERFYQQAKIRFGKRVDERFKRLEKIKESK